MDVQYSAGRAMATLVIWPIANFTSFVGRLILIQGDGYPIVLKKLAWVLMGFLVPGSLAYIRTASNVGWTSGMRESVYLLGGDM